MLFSLNIIGHTGSLISVFDFVIASSDESCCCDDHDEDATQISDCCDVGCCHLFCYSKSSSATYKRIVDAMSFFVPEGWLIFDGLPPCGDGWASELERPPS